MSKLAIYKDNCSLKVGDLGNVSAGEDGRASFRLADRLIKVIPSMEGKKGVITSTRHQLCSWYCPCQYEIQTQVWDVIGRSVVVSSNPDDLGLGSAPTSAM